MLCIAGCLLALLPPAIVIQHALFLFLFRKRFTSNQGSMTGELAFLQAALRTAQAEELKEFSPLLLSVRYGLPAFLIAALGVTWCYLLCDSPTLIADKIPAIRLGIAGAYVYVLLTLGQRNFRRDITSGVAIWCAVTLALGPVLAGVLAFVWTGSADDLSGNWGAASIYFLAGLAPRYVTSVLEEAARRLLQSADGAIAPMAPRTLPLTQLRGISTQIADRLGEEGILDVYGLAMANPNRLLRNTSFDTRQILAWMDEALLISALPKQWQKLEDNGITGAIDLAWYSPDNSAQEAAGPQLPPPVMPPPAVPPPAVPPPAAPPPAVLPPVPVAAPAQPQPSAGLGKLAECMELDVQTVGEIVARLYEDAQVRLVWALYQAGSSEASDGQNS